MNEWRILQGDALEMLRNLEDESVNCCVTSPPYWGLRDYGTAEWDGGETDCDHDGTDAGGTSQRAGRSYQQGHPMGVDCRRCGAIRIDKQIGLERTPEEYVQKLVEIFREVRRVLRPDGTLWLNLGDSYSGSGKGGNPDEGKQSTNRGSQSIGVLYGKTGETVRHAAVTNVSRHFTAEHETLKPKDLIGIPWRVALALQADGWYLRSEIIWSKPNPMPESVTDRPTRAHEYIFLLAKNERYRYDSDAIREPYKEETVGRYAYSLDGTAPTCRQGNGDISRRKSEAGMREPNLLGRNRRTVWEVATHPYPSAHFATFPPKLIEPCILAGCPIGGTVLDPFSGAGTTGLVALRFNRKFIGIELNPEYVEMATRRIEQDAPLFNTVLK